MSYDGIAIIEVGLAAAAFAAVARRASEKPPTWPARLFVSAGAAVAVGGAAFTGVCWTSVRGSHSFDTLGAMLLAVIFGAIFAASTFLTCLIFSGTEAALRSLVRWSIPMAYASAGSFALYELVYGA